MRTTLSLETDVAAAIDRVRQETGASLKDTVNRALRIGLRTMEEPGPRPSVYETPSESLGGCLLGSLDDVAEALAVAEGETFR